MKKGDIFAFVSPNGVEITAIVVNLISWEPFGEYDGNTYGIYTWLCYSQNRLFTYKEIVSPAKTTPKDKPYFHFVAEGEKRSLQYSRVIVDYCVLPDYDTLLEDYYHQLDKAIDYSDREL